MQISMTLYIERLFKINLKEHRLPKVALVSVHLPARDTEERWVRSLDGKIPWRRAWQPAHSHGQRSLEGYSPWGRTELDTTEEGLNMQSQQIQSRGSVVRTKTVCKPDRAYSSFQNVKYRVNDGMTRLVNE